MSQTHFLMNSLDPQQWLQKYREEKLVICISLTLGCQIKKKSSYVLFKETIKYKEEQAVHDDNTEQRQGLWGRMGGQGAGNGLSS